MNPKTVIYLAFFALLASSCHNRDDRPIPRADSSVIQELHARLAQKDYFKLDAQYRGIVPELADSERLFFKAVLDNAFNRNTDCIKDVDTLMDLFKDRPYDSAWFQLKSLQEDSYFKTFQYARAAKCDSEILANCKTLHKETLDDVANKFIIRNGLKNTPAQQTLIKNNTTLKWTKDLLGLIETPVRIGSQIADAIWDTRANISTISKTYAKKLDLHMLNIDYKESSGVTGIQFRTDMGIADSLKIGDIEMKNVVFQVMPDSILYIAEAKFQLNLIIGFPIIEQWGEVHVRQDRTMTIPAIPSHSSLHNFALDGLDPVIALACGQDTLPFHFNSGASSSVFYASYFNRYKKDIQKTGVEKNEGIGGAGGVVKRNVYILSKVSLGIGGKSVSIDSVDVNEKAIIPGETFYGNIGQDFIQQFSEVVYNFRDMYVDGIKK